MKTERLPLQNQLVESKPTQWDSEGYTTEDTPISFDTQYIPNNPEAWETKGRFSVLGSAVRSLVRRIKDRREARGVLTQKERYSQEAKEYWERGTVEEAPRFYQQVGELKRPYGAEERMNVLSVTPESVIHSDITGGHSKVQFTEREGMLDLDTFLDQVLRATDGKTDGWSRQMHEQANIMEQNFTFLGKEQYDTACKGIAQMWSEYLQQSNDRVLNIYNPRGENGQGNRKSYNAVFDSIMHHFDEINASDNTVRQRLRTEPSQWQDTSGAKLVIVDDWITSGATVRKNMKEAMDMAYKLGVDRLAQKAEAHALILRKDQVGRTLEAGQDSFALRGYYAAPSEHGPYTVAPSGAHSSVDYGFQIPLKEMHRYLAENGIYRDVPLLADVQRDYYENTPKVWKGDLLSEIGSLNMLYNQIKNEEAMLTAEINHANNSQQTKVLQERLYASRGSLQAVWERRQNLLDQYERT